MVQFYVRIYIFTLHLYVARTSNMHVSVVAAICSGGCVANSYCVRPGICRCRSGYTFNGDKCTKRHIKCAHPCLNGGVCKHGYCKCTQYYYGHMCQYGRTAALLINNKTGHYQLATKFNSKNKSRTQINKVYVQNSGLQRELNSMDDKFENSFKTG